jgi:hypothetical protein
LDTIDYAFDSGSTRGAYLRIVHYFKFVWSLIFCVKYASLYINLLPWAKIDLNNKLKPILSGESVRSKLVANLKKFYSDPSFRQFPNLGVKLIEDSKTTEFFYPNASDKQ